jgi:hypothetical protein
LQSLEDISIQQTASFHPTAPTKPCKWKRGAEDKREPRLAPVFLSELLSSIAVESWALETSARSQISRHWCVQILRGYFVVLESCLPCKGDEEKEKERAEQHVLEKIR